MSGNSFGQIFRVTTFGESHGKALGCIIDGCPPGIEIDEALIQVELDKRKPGTSKFVTQRKEADKVEILSGIFEGKTTGTAIALIVYNHDQRSLDYSKIKNQFRPGHADFSFWIKYGIRDYRGGGRSSARETVARVAAGAIAKKWLKQQYNINIAAYISQIGEKMIQYEDEKFINQNPFFIANQSQVLEIEQYLDSIRKETNSIGSKLTVVAKNVPGGLGEPVFGKLDAEIAYAMMGINAVKAVEIGDGVAVVAQKGSYHGDEIVSQGFLSNHAGGILGGISSGQDLIAHLSIKPTSSIAIPKKSIDIDGNEIEVVTHGRHDPCVGLRAAPIAEAMMALVIMDQILRYRAQCADVSVQNPLYSKFN